MYLLDTNALLALFHDEVAEAQLSESTKQIMMAEDRLYVSVASLWEIAVKVKIGKLDLKMTISEVEDNCYQMGVEIIPIKSKHMDETLKIPLFKDHGDPFDRLIMATSIVEGMTLVSLDRKIRRKEYGIDLIW